MVKVASRVQGSALLSALFIMTLVAIAATAMSLRLQLDIYRLRTILTSDKLYLASQAGTFWAIDLLSQPNLTLPPTESPEIFAHYPKSLQRIYPQVTLSGNLYDLQAYFNINNLQDKKARALFLKLLEVTTESSNKSLVDATSYWIHPYQPGRGQDQYLQYYSNQKPPYLPAYQSLQSISEFRLIKGVNAKLYEATTSLLTALPEPTPININSAPLDVLKLLGNGLTDSEANELIQARGKTGIADLNEISILLEKLDISRDQITLKSEYFLSIIKAVKEDRKLSCYTIFKRKEEKNGNISVKIIYNSLNAL